ncbi:MAG: hypothetical protein QOF81_792 [Acidimicrobiaceae bacterium]|nr:hypothetical protein [Acidimicrobiaceae bacterium]
MITIAVLTALPKRTPLWTTDLPRLPGRRTPARLSASLVRVRPPSEADRCWRHFAGCESGAGAPLASIVVMGPGTGTGAGFRSDGLRRGNAIIGGPGRAEGSSKSGGYWCHR